MNPDSIAGREIAQNMHHPALQRTYWINLYPSGEMTSALCATKDEALNRCTYAGEVPNAIQVEVRIVPLSAQEDASKP